MQTSSSPTTAQRIRHIIESVLDVPVPDESTNLISLGANSMEMVRIINRLEDELGFRPRFEDLSTNPSIEALTLAYDLTSSPAPHQDAPAPETSSTPPTAGRHDEPGLTSGIRIDALYARMPLPEATAPELPVMRSQRSFGAAALSSAALSVLLSPLRQLQTEGAHAAYASAGRGYAVQTYLQLQPGACADLPCGLYYYQPERHELWLLAPDLVIEPTLYEPVVNAPIARQAAFALYFVSRPAALKAKYGARARDYCLIEAGAMAQLLRERAYGSGVGLCAIGEFDVGPIQSWFELEPDQECLHSMLGGRLT